MPPVYTDDLIATLAHAKTPIEIAWLNMVYSYNNVFDISYNPIEHIILCSF